MTEGYYERRVRHALLELSDAAIALDDVWKELGSCETTGDRVDAHFGRFLEAVNQVRAAREIGSGDV